MCVKGGSCERGCSKSLGEVGYGHQSSVQAGVREEQGRIEGLPVGPCELLVVRCGITSWKEGTKS